MTSPLSRPAAGRAWRLVPLAAAALLMAQQAQALSFAQAYEAARLYDAPYRSARHELNASQLNVPIARASLLPSLNLTAGESSVQGWRQFPNGLNQEVRTRLDYNTPQANLALRVPLINYEAYANFKQAQAQSELADEVYRAQGMDLIDRLAAAYLQLLLAGEARHLAETQVRSVETQLGQIQQRERRGEGTRVQVAQIQANLDVGRARLLEAVEQQDLSRRQLERLTGTQDSTVPPLPAEITPIPQDLTRLDDWIKLAVQNSPQLSGRMRNAEVARLAVQRQQAAHMPRIDIVGSLSRSESDTVSNIGQSSTLRSIGIQFSLPLFSGGGVVSSVKQAQERESQAQEDVRNEREALEVDVQRFFQAISTGAQKIAAYQRAVDSTALAWQAARRSQEMGLGTLADVADAQSAHFSARRDLAQARVDQLLARVRLRIRAGIPMSDVAAELDGLLTAVAAPGASGGKP